MPSVDIVMWASITSNVNMHCEKQKMLLQTHNGTHLCYGDYLRAHAAAMCLGQRQEIWLKHTKHDSKFRRR